MAYANLTPNLQDMFNQINDRLRKLESGPNSAQYAADAAQSTAITASSSAATAAAGAAAAQAIAATAIQKDSYNIFNASNQLTAINGNGITVYAGSSPTTGARVVLNSNGLTGTDGSTTTFAINASTGNVSLTGALVTGGSISGASISIGGGNFAVTSGGVMSATGATISGSITSTSGSIGGWKITSTLLYAGSSLPFATATLDSSSGAAAFGALTCTSLGASSTVTLSGNTTIAAYIYNTGAATTTSSANVFMNSTSGLIARVTSSERYKVEITPETIPVQSIMALVPKSYVDKAEYQANNNSATGLPRYLGLIAEDLAQLPVLKDLLVNYNEQGQPDSVNYDRIAIALVPLVQDLNNRLTALEAK